MLLHAEQTHVGNILPLLFLRGFLAPGLSFERSFRDPPAFGLFLFFLLSFRLLLPISIGAPIADDESIFSDRETCMSAFSMPPITESTLPIARPPSIRTSQPSPGALSSNSTSKPPVCDSDTTRPFTVMMPFGLPFYT